MARLHVGLALLLCVASLGHCFDSEDAGYIVTLIESPEPVPSPSVSPAPPNPCNATVVVPVHFSNTTLNITVHEPGVMLGGSLAGLLGLWGYGRLSDPSVKNIPGVFLMSLIYLQYAVMMMIGVGNHCFNSVICGIGTATFTSNIGLSFGLAAIMGLGGFRSWTHRKICIVLASTTVLFFIGYIVNMSAKTFIWFMVLYLGPMLFGCGSYVLYQLYYLIRHRITLQALGYLLAAVVAGVVGTVAAFDPTLVNWICETISPAISSQAIFYNLSNVSMLAVFEYYWLQIQPGMIELIALRDIRENNMLPTTNPRMAIYR